MARTLTPLRDAILDRMAAPDAPGVWTPGDFADLAPRDTVDKTLQRLVLADVLRRIDRGLYDRPGHNSLTQKPTAPDPRAVVGALARRDQTRVLVDGMTAANDLGLTNAVPSKIIIHADTRRRSIKLDNLVISFRQTAPSKLYWAGRPAMRVVQAIQWLRDTMTSPSERSRVVKRLSALFDDPDAGPVLRGDLLDGMTALPGWMQDFLRPLLLPSTPSAPKDAPA